MRRRVGARHLLQVDRLVLYGDGRDRRTPSARSARCTRRRTGVRPHARPASSKSPRADLDRAADLAATHATRVRNEDLLRGIPEIHTATLVPCGGCDHRGGPGRRCADRKPASAIVRSSSAASCLSTAATPGFACDGEAVGGRTAKQDGLGAKGRGLRGGPCRGECRRPSAPLRPGRPRPAPRRARRASRSRRRADGRRDSTTTIPTRRARARGGRRRRGARPSPEYGSSSSARSESRSAQVRHKVRERGERHQRRRLDVLLQPTRLQSGRAGR